MTNWLKDNKEYIGIAITVMVQLLLLAFWFGAMKTAVANITEKVDDHIHNQSVHMPLERKMETFVTRAEYNMESARLQRIESKIDQLQQYIMDLEK